MTTLFVFAALYLLPGVLLTWCGYGQHADEIRAAHTALIHHRGRAAAAATMGAGAAVAVLLWPRLLPEVAANGPRCCWCGIRMAGLRRWWASACRLCAPRLHGSAGIYLSAGGPPVPHMSRVDEVETRRG